MIKIIKEYLSRKDMVQGFCFGVTFGVVFGIVIFFLLVGIL